MHKLQFDRREDAVAGGFLRSLVTAEPRRTAQPFDRLRPLAFVAIAAILLGVVAAPSTGRAQDDNTTPDPSTAGGLPAMLDRVPAFLPGLQSHETATISYSNIAAQLDAVGIAPPTSIDDPGFGVSNRAIVGLSLPGIITKFRFFPEDFGFDIVQWDETLEIDAPPFRLTMIRGRFDQMGVLVALGRLGYTPSTPGSAILAIRPDYEEDFQSPAGYASPGTNVATILADGTLVFAPSQAIVAAVLDVQSGQGESLAERADVAALLHHVPADLAAAEIVGGQRLASATAASTDAGSMPPVVLALMGNTVGGPLPPDARSGTPAPIRSDAPTSREISILLMRTVEDAVEAVPVVEARLTTGATVRDGRSFTEFFSGWTVRAVPGESVLLIDLAPTAGRWKGVLFDMLLHRDLDFVAWK